MRQIIEKSSKKFFLKKENLENLDNKTRSANRSALFDKNLSKGVYSIENIEKFLFEKGGQNLKIQKLRKIVREYSKPVEKFQKITKEKIWH